MKLTPIARPQAFVASTGNAAGKISFKKYQLDDKFRSEGVCVGDFNRDGKLDIAAGSVWFSAPDWKRHNVLAKAEQFNPKGYSKSFVNAAQDFNGDGWPDLLVVDFPGAPTWWFANPGKSAGPWKRNMIAPVTNNESPDFRDIDGDGRRELFFAFPPLNQIGFAKVAANVSGRWPTTAISAPKAPSTAKFAHGLGAGDLNGDGRNDVLVPQGWWEAPAERTKASWKFHPANFGSSCAQMIVYDFDGDGDADVLTSSAHGFGIWWHEQLSQGKTALGWKTHLIDKSFSETHSIVLADINGDGLPDFVTGKRWWSHGGGGPGGNQPAVLHWFELRRKGGRPVWTRHQIDNDSGVGTAFEVADVNGDGLLDIVTSNKKGTFYFKQQRE
ncbi:MAG: VCBS repeat-containing protein [Planctomycetes bacterium]|nr:VCBS repeat-containing protein [Planctomycetota bacterium]